MNAHRSRLSARWVALGSLILVAVTAAVAHAQPSTYPADPADPADPSDRPIRKPLEWNPAWPRFRLWEYGGTAALGVGALLYERSHHAPDQPHWSGGILFDGAARSWLRASSPEGRATAQHLSDRLWLAGTAYPFVIDLSVALFAHRQPAVAWQMAMMDLEAYAVTGFLNRVLEFEVGRARPSREECAANPDYDQLCGSSSNNASFPSGHTLGIATAAGLTCVHHRYLPLYGNPVADAAPCVLMTVATATTGVARIVGDRHHASDVLVGAALGFGVGYTLPWLLHYRHGSRLEEKDERRTVLLPWAAPGGVGAAVVGVL
jgi:membrane-associated phospholipid phosphatase